MHGTIWLLTLSVICIFGCSIHAGVGDTVGSCEDGDDKCPGWAKTGDCNRIPHNMNVLCRKSCNRCHLPFLCEDDKKSCKVWAQAGECTTNPHYMRWFCRHSCDTCIKGEKRATEERNPSQKLVIQFKQADSYPDSDGAPLPSSCEDGDDKCPGWAEKGDCNRIPHNMNVLCRKSCNRCHLPFLCEDSHKSCKVWAQAGECKNNPHYMRWFCRHSCDTCTKGEKRATEERDPSQKLVLEFKQADSFKYSDSDGAPLPNMAPQSSRLSVWGVVFLGCVGVFVLGRVQKVMF